MLDGLSPARRRTVLAVAAVVVLAAVAVVAAALLRARGAGDPVAQDRPGPVLLVAGYGGSTRALDPVRDQLAGEGRTVVVVPALAGNTGDLDAQADALGRAAERALDDTEAGSVDVVGYSAGGVVARLWVRDHGGDAVARRVLTIGSPHHGTDLAALARGLAGTCPKACEQLEPDSALLRSLDAGDETPAGPRWVSVWSTADRVVVPADSARLAGALDLTVQQLCPGARTSHGGLPGHPAVLAVVRAALGAGPVGVPRPSC